MNTSTVRTDMDQKPSPTPSAGANYIARDNMERAGLIALEQRRAKGEIMIYVEDGWVVREYPGQRVVKLAPVDEYRADDFPVEG